MMEHRGEYESEWAAICSIAEKIGCTPDTLRKWVRRAERDSGKRAGLTTAERDRIKELEREVRELKQGEDRRATMHGRAAYAPARHTRRGAWSSLQDHDGGR